MEHTTLEREARKTSIELEPLWSPKASDIEVVSRLRTILEEDRATRIQVDAPTANADACSPVRVTVSWTRPAQAGSFQAQLDGKDISGQFTVNETMMKATALLDVDGGTDPTLRASVVMYRWLPTPGFRRMEADASFHVPAPRWDLTVSGTIGSDGLPVIDVLPGTFPIRVTITPTQCTPPDLTIKAFTGFGLADQVAGISFQIPFTIPKGSSYGFLKATIDPAVKAGTYWAYVFAQTPQDVAIGAAETLRGFWLNVLPH